MVATWRIPPWQPTLDSPSSHSSMARPRRDAAIDLGTTHDLTAGLIERLRCPEGKSQAFLRDSRGNGLRVRVTSSGAKSYVFEAKLNRSTVRRTLGDVRTLTIEEARVEARRQQALLDKGVDPRELQREMQAAQAAARAAQEAEQERLTITGLTAWADYTAEGRAVGFSSRGRWGDRHAQDHDTMVDAGGKPFKRGKGVTAAGPLHGLLSRPLMNIDTAAVEEWLRAENVNRPARAALAFRLLRGFLNWCQEHAKYQLIAPAGAHQPRKVRKLVRKQKASAGVLQREQLAAWFKAVRSDCTVVRSTYLQILLLTGARKSEIAEMKWGNVDLNFGGSLRIADKFEGERTIPCTPYVQTLLTTLPRNSEWVFGPDAATLAHNAAYNHRRALKAAGIPHLSLQALRKSFGTLSEWVECPVGIVAQLQGHKPSATAEKHYRERPLDLLRMWATTIEGWMLKEAGIRRESVS